MKSIWRFVVTFLVITGAVAVVTGLTGLSLRNQDYWQHHGYLFLFGISLFPRVTLILSSIPSGGLAWWLSWLIAPRLLVAVLATFEYWVQNPFLVVIAWLVAIGGESSEKFAVVRRSKVQFGTSRARPSREPKWVEAEIVSSNSKSRTD